jgi:hypothetical protein
MARKMSGRDVLRVDAGVSQLGRARMRGLLVAGAIASLGAFAGVVVLGAGASSAAVAVAVAARTENLRESGNLRVTGHPNGVKLNEQGSASGTINGTIYIHLNLSSQTRVSAEVNIYPSGGSLSGYGSASYHVVGAYASFSGTLSITRGTGKYAHARARGLRFSGSIKRVNDATTVAVSGPLSY